MNNKEYVTPFGLFTTIVVTVIGVGIFSYPRELADVVGTDGWNVTIIAGIIIYLLIYISYKVIKANNYNKLYDILQSNFGSVIGTVLALVFIASNIFVISLGMRIFIEVIKMYLLEKTPTEFILIVTILTGTYLVRGEIDALIKFNELSFWIMFIPIIVILLLTLNRTDFTNILPVFNSTPLSYLRGLKTAAYSFAGIEIIYLILPFMKDRKSVPRVALKGIGFITIFYTIIVIFTLAIFSVHQSKVLLWPTITMIKSINIPGSFIERWEGIVMALWVIFYFTTFINMYYLSADIAKDAFRLQDIKLSSVLIVPFIYAIALYPENIAQLYDINNNITSLFLLFSLVILPLVLFLGKTSRKRVKEGENSK